MRASAPSTTHSIEPIDPITASAGSGPIRAAIVALVLATAGASPASGDAWFSGIGDAPGGTFDSRAADVSDDGVVVGTGSDSVYYDVGLPDLPTGTQIAFERGRVLRWTRDEGLEVFPPDVNGGLDISADGSVMLLRGRDEGGLLTYLWTETDGLLDTGLRVHALDLSDDGTTIVGHHGATSVSRSTVEAFRWTASGGLEALGFLPHPNVRSVAYGVSADGSVVAGTSRNHLLAPGFHWTDEDGMQPLDEYAYYLHSIAGISGDGRSIIGAVEGRLFVWSPGVGYRIVEDTFNRGIPKQMADIDHHGLRVVGGNWTSSLPAAFVWDPVWGMRSLQDVLENDYDLDLAGWTLTMARGISPNGRYIVGEGINPDGNREGWVAHLDGPMLCGGGFELALALPLIVALRRWRSRASATPRI